MEHADYSGPGKETGGKRSPAHKGVTGWGYFVKTVQIDGQVFDLLANVRKKQDGEYVYSIQLNENKQMSASPVAVFAQGDPASEWGTTDTDSVAQETPEVKPDYSLREDQQDAAEQKPSGGKFSQEHRGQLTAEELAEVQGIGRKSVNELTSDELSAVESFARRYYQELGEKSPFFRAWFGDWRVNDQTPVQIATQRGDARGVQVNDDTGWNIQVSGKVFNETAAHTAPQNITAREYLPFINDIVKKAILLDSYTLENTKSENSLLMHSLYAVADTGAGPELLKLYVEEMNDPNQADTAKRAYQLQNIERQQSGAKGSGESPSPVSRTADIKSVADLLRAVKTRDKAFSPKDASKVVDAEGKPLVVYHGTDAEFNTFQSSDGVYWFSAAEDYAEEMAHERGGERIVQAYLDMKKPYYATLEPGQFTDPVFERPVIQAARDGGHDGIILRADTDNELLADTFYIVFKPTQIKSATDNIGTFDRKNPDINYSLREDSRAKVAALETAAQRSGPMSREALAEQIMSRALPLPQGSGDGQMERVIREGVQKGLTKLAATPEGKLALFNLALWKGDGFGKAFDEAITDWVVWSTPDSPTQGSDQLADALYTTLVDYFQNKLGSDEATPKPEAEKTKLTPPDSGSTIGEQKGREPTIITDGIIQRVPLIEIPGLADEEWTAIQEQHKELLQHARDENEGKEVAFVFRPGLTDRRVFLGTDDSLDFGQSLSGTDLIVMHNHPRNGSFSDLDINFFLEHNGIRCLTIVKNSGELEAVIKTDMYDQRKATAELKRFHKKYVKTGSIEEITKMIRAFLEMQERKRRLRWVNTVGN